MRRRKLDSSVNWMVTGFRGRHPGLASSNSIGRPSLCGMVWALEVTGAPSMLLFPVQSKSINAVVPLTGSCVFDRFSPVSPHACLEMRREYILLV